MRYQFYKNNIRVDDSLTRVIENKVGKVEERLKRYHPDAADLEIRLAHQDKVKEYECDLKLTAFRNTMNAKKTGPDLRVAVDRSFEALMRELDNYRAKVNPSL